MKNLKFIESVVKMPLMDLPVRSVVVSVGGREILISPGSKIPRETYDSKAPVTDIVASNMFHHAGVPKAASIYKSANLWAVPGLAQKRPDIQWTKTLVAGDWPYSDELPMIHLEGSPKVSEVVFVHKPTRSLIVTDMCFNITNIKGFGAGLIFRLFGTYNRLGTSRFFAKFIKDRNAFEKSLGRLFELDFDNIIVSHGENVFGGGKDKLRAILKERGFTPRK